MQKRRDLPKAEYLDLQTVFDIYGIKPSTVKREIWEQKARKLKQDSKRGIGVHVPHYKIGGKINFKKTEITTYSHFYMSFSRAFFSNKFLILFERKLMLRTNARKMNFRKLEHI